MEKKKIEYVELTKKDIKLLYDFAVVRIAKICLTANPGSGMYKKAMSCMKREDQKDAVIDFIVFHNRVIKGKPVRV